MVVLTFSDRGHSRCSRIVMHFKPSWPTCMYKQVNTCDIKYKLTLKDCPLSGYCLSNYLLQRHWVTAKHDMDALSWLNAETLKRAPTPLFGRRVKCSALGALSQDYGRYTQHFWQALSHACACHYASMWSLGITFCLLNEAVGIETFYALTWYGHFQAHRVLLWRWGMDRPAGKYSRRLSWLQTFEDLSTSTQTQSQAMHVQPLNHISLNSARLPAV